MSFSNGEVVTNKYWDIRYDDSEHKLRTEMSMLKIVIWIKNFVKRMLISDVPVSAF